MNMWFRTIYLKYIAQLLTKNLWSTVNKSLQHGSLSSNLIDQNGVMQHRYRDNVLRQEKYSNKYETFLTFVA